MCVCVLQWEKKKNTTSTSGQKYQLFPIGFDPGHRKTPNKVYLVIIKLLSDPEVNHHSVQRWRFWQTGARQVKSAKWKENVPSLVVVIFLVAFQVGYSFPSECFAEIVVEMQIKQRDWSPREQTFWQWINYGADGHVNRIASDTIWIGIGQLDSLSVATGTGTEQWAVRKGCSMLSSFGSFWRLLEGEF